MDRRIDFRGWDGNKMWYPSDNFNVILEFNKISGWNLTPNRPGYKGEYLAGESQSKTPMFTLLQFTGLKDKNGKDIYEGDVLDCQDRIVQVVWHEQAGQWDSKFIRYQFDLCSSGIQNLDWKYRAVVIGNIHENPELI